MSRKETKKKRKKFKKKNATNNWSFAIEKKDVFFFQVTNLLNLCFFFLDNSFSLLRFAKSIIVVFFPFFLHSEKETRKEKKEKKERINVWKFCIRFVHTRFFLRITYFFWKFSSLTCAVLKNFKSIFIRNWLNVKQFDWYLTSQRMWASARAFASLLNETPESNRLAKKNEKPFDNFLIPSGFATFFFSVFQC